MPSPAATEAAFPAHRDRLVRLCARLTGDAHAAEDLAQEALVVALRHAREGRLPDAWEPWLTGVAKMLCRGWLSRRAGDVRRTGALTEESAPADEGEADPLAALLDGERGDLLERAFADLDASARSLLAARYLDDAPLEEIAGKLGLTTNAAAVRLHRAREAAQKTLAVRHREAAAAHGLLDADSAAGWTETRLWCCRCGTRRMLGRADRAGGFALRCAACDPRGTWMRGLSTQAATLDGAAVLGGVQGFRAGLRRVHAWWQRYVADGLAKGRAACVRCGAAAAVRTGWLRPDGTVGPGFVAECGHCPERFYIAPGGLVFHAPQMAAFWQEHPRLRYVPPKALVFAGRQAILTGFADRQSSARLEIVFARDDLTTLSVNGA